MPILQPRSPREVQIARDEWRGIGWKARRSVARQARHGHLPADARRHRIAVRWSYTVFAADETRERRASGLVLAIAWGVLLETVSAALHLGSDGSALGGALGTEGNWRERRLARRLQRLDQDSEPTP